MLPEVGAGAGDPVAPVLLALALILAGAKLGGHVAERIGQPAVLGELFVGVVLGSLPALRLFAATPAIDVLASLGAVILLFEVGLESSVRDMLTVGVRSFLVAVLGVVTPWALGWWVAALLLPERSLYVHLFLGATLTATSVGITARVLKDMGHSQAPEARIILGAAVIDDVLGLMILAVVGSLIGSANLGGVPSFAAVGLVLLKAGGFLAVALGLGTALSRGLFRLSSGLRGSGVLLSTALVICFLLADLASVIGLAPIVGAYAAGLILEESHFLEFVARGERPLRDLISPVATLLVPLFFVLMGMRVDLSGLFQPGVLGLAGLLTLAAIAGKQACALGGWGDGLSPLAIGIGMIPRGEVGLIFANLGLGLTIHGERIVDQASYSAIVIMVMVTTLVTPAALKWSLERRAGALVPVPTGKG